MLDGKLSCKGNLKGYESKEVQVLNIYSKGVLESLEDHKENELICKFNGLWTALEEVLFSH